MKPTLLAWLCLILPAFSYSQEVFAVNSLVSNESVIESVESSDHNIQRIPFDLLGGLIMVDAEIEGEEVSCIFDTGAPSIVINKNEDEINYADGYITGVTGKMKMKNSRVRTFKLGELKKKNLDAIEIDISHIEQMKQEEINGILGVDIYRNKEILVDYEHKILEVLPRKHKGKLTSKAVTHSVPFYMEDQLPVIKVKIGKKYFYFGVDTGAEVNVIDTRCLKKLKKCKYLLGEEKILAGVDNNKNIAPSIIIDEYQIKKQKHGEIEFAFMDMKRFNHCYGVQLDGILGYPFLSENLISFDFRRSKLNFWEELRSEEYNKDAAVIAEAASK